MNNKLYKIILILSIAGLILPNFSLAQEAQVPETMEEVKSFGSKILEGLPNAVKKVWQEEAMPIWQGMWDWARPIIEPWRQKFMSFLGKEIEKRKPLLEEEFQKEKEELRKELPGIKKSLWKRFKELLK